MNSLEVSSIISACIKLHQNLLILLQVPGLRSSTKHMSADLPRPIYMACMISLKLV